MIYYEKLLILFWCMVFVSTSITINAQIFGGNSNTSGGISETDGNIHVEGVGHQKNLVQMVVYYI